MCVCVRVRACVHVCDDTDYIHFKGKIAMFGQINVQLRLGLQSHAYPSIQNDQKAIATLFLYTLAI